MKTSVLYYCAFCIVVISSVLFGLDWQPAALSPMAPVKVVAFAPPPPPPPPAPVKVPSAATPTATTPRTVVPAAPVNNAAAPPVAPVAVTQPAEPPKPLCDVAACAAAYRSFRASDCTYNPSFGERRLCTKGVMPSEAAPGVAPNTAQPSIIQAEPGKQPNATVDTQPKPQCNVSACATAYRSFTESDCTFLATGGLRKLCTK